MKQKESTEKACYRLWWDYLHRSDDYREICKWCREGEDLKKLPEKYKRPYKFKKETSCVSLEELKLSEREFRLWRPYDRVLVYEDGIKRWLLSPIISFYEISGDIYNTSFDTWYRNIKKKRKTEDNRKVVGNYLDSIKNDLKTCMAFLKLRHGRVATTRELIDFFVDEYLGSPYRMIVEVDCFDIDSEELKAAFFQYVRDWKNNNATFEEENSRRKLGIKPIGRVEYTALSRYLNVYDIWLKNKTDQKRNWTPDVRDQIPYYKKHEAFDVGDIKKAIRRARDHAIKIISNAARGIFPGNY